MRRVTTFCILVASILLLLHGARSEHAFCQNAREIPNLVEHDAYKNSKSENPEKQNLIHEKQLQDEEIRHQETPKDVTDLMNGKSNNTTDQGNGLTTQRRIQIYTRSTRFIFARVHSRRNLRSRGQRMRSRINKKDKEQRRYRLAIRQNRVSSRNLKTKTRLKTSSRRGTDSINTRLRADRSVSKSSRFRERNENGKILKIRRERRENNRTTRSSRAATNTRRLSQFRNSRRRMILRLRLENNQRLMRRRIYRQRQYTRELRKISDQKRRKISITSGSSRETRTEMSTRSISIYRKMGDRQLQMLVTPAQRVRRDRERVSDNAEGIAARSLNSKESSRSRRRMGKRQRNTQLRHEKHRIQTRKLFLYQNRFTQNPASSIKSRSVRQNQNKRLIYGQIRLLHNEFRRSRTNRRQRESKKSDIEVSATNQERNGGKNRIVSFRSNKVGTQRQIFTRDGRHISNKRRGTRMSKTRLHRLGQREMQQRRYRFEQPNMRQRRHGFEQRNMHLRQRILRLEQRIIRQNIYHLGERNTLQRRYRHEQRIKQQRRNRLEHQHMGQRSLRQRRSNDNRIQKDAAIFKNTKRQASRFSRNRDKIVGDSVHSMKRYANQKFRENIIGNLDNVYVMMSTSVSSRKASFSRSRRNRLIYSHALVPELKETMENHFASSRKSQRSSNRLSKDSIRYDGQTYRNVVDARKSNNVYHLIPIIKTESRRISRNMKKNSNPRRFRQKRHLKNKRNVRDINVNNWKDSEKEEIKQQKSIRHQRRDIVKRRRTNRSTKVLFDNSDQEGVFNKPNNSRRREGGNRMFRMIRGQTKVRNTLSRKGQNSFMQNQLKLDSKQLSYYTERRYRSSRRQIVQPLERKLTIDSSMTQNKWKRSRKIRNMDENSSNKNIDNIIGFDIKDRSFGEMLLRKEDGTYEKDRLFDFAGISNGLLFGVLGLLGTRIKQNSV